MPAKRPNFETIHIGKMREVDTLLNGYILPMATAFNNGLVMQTQAFDIYGLNQQLTYQNLDGANLEIQSVEDQLSRVVVDVATGQAPYANTARVYRARENVRIDVVRNLWNADGDGYDAVEFWGNWNTTPKTATGGPRDQGVLSLTGRCRAPFRLWGKDGTKIAGISDVVALTAGVDGDSEFDGTAGGQVANHAGITKIPAMKPFRSFDSYAFSVELQCRNGKAGAGTAVNHAVKIPVTSSLVDNTGTISLTEADVSPYGLTLDSTGAVAATNKTIVTHAFVHYLYTPADQTARALIGDGIDNVKGRFEV